MIEALSITVKACAIISYAYSSYHGLQEGRTALHQALVLGIAERNLEFCRELISLGADVNIKDEVCVILKPAIT